MHLPLLALMWVVAALGGIGAVLVIAMLFTVFCDVLAEAIESHRKRVHQEATRADWRERKRSIDSELALLLKLSKEWQNAYKAGASSPWDTIARVKLRG